MVHDHNARRAGAARTLGRLATVAIVAALGVATAGATAAQADGRRTATSSGWGATPAAGSANAQANARAELTSQAAAAGEVCTNVASSATHVYTAPDGSAYVFNGTASGYCAVPPPPPPPPPPSDYTVARSETRQGQAATWNTALSNGAATARAAILAVGVDCIYSSTSGSTAWSAPDGSWYVVNATVEALCTN